MDGASWLAVAVGVANNEDSGTGVGSPNVPRVNPKGTRSISKHVQIAPHRGHPLGRSAPHVLDDDMAWPQLPDDPSILPPKTRPTTGQATAPAVRRRAQVLAREPTADYIYICERSGASMTHVFQALYTGPVLRQHSSAHRVRLYLPHNSPDASTLKS